MKPFFTDKSRSAAANVLGVSFPAQTIVEGYYFSSQHLPAQS